MPIVGDPQEPPDVPVDYPDAEHWAKQAYGLETPLVKDLRDLAALQTKDAHNPFAERKLTFYWKAADEIERLNTIIDRLLISGNHIATYRTERWPDYALDGLTRSEQCDHALRILGATKEYDMWCCWSAMMQARDELESIS